MESSIFPWDTMYYYSLHYTHYCLKKIHFRLKFITESSFFWHLATKQFVKFKIETHFIAEISNTLFVRKYQFSYFFKSELQGVENVPFIISTVFCGG